VADLFFGRRPRGERLFMVAVPLGLFAAWWLGWGRQADSEMSFANIVDAPLYVFEAVGAGLESLLGLNSPEPGADAMQRNLGLLLAFAGLIAGCLRIRRLGGLPRGVAVALAIGLTFWGLAAINQTIDRPPDASRYQYPSAVFLLLIGAGMLQGVRIGRRPLVVAAALTGVAALSGAAALHREYERLWLPASENLRASLAGLEIAGERPDADFAAVAFPPNMAPSASDYFQLVRTAGSPAFSESELIARGDPYASAADFTLAYVHELRLEPASVPGSLDGCRHLAGNGWLEVPPSTSTLVARGRQPVLISVSRFSSDPSVPLGKIAPAAGMRVRIPPDRSSRPWRLHIDEHGPVAVCRPRA
jgi:hypothetical protein